MRTSKVLFFSILLLAGPLPGYEIPRAQRELPLLLDHPELAPAGQRAWMSAYGFPATEAEAVETVAYTPDGTALVVGDTGDHSGSPIEAGNVTFWELDNALRRWSVKPFAATLYGGNYPTIDEMEVSPNGNLISVIASNDVVDSPHSLVVLNSRDGSTVRTVQLASFYGPCVGRLNNAPILLDPVTARFSSDSRSLFVIFKNQYGHNFGSCRPHEDRWLIQLDATSGAIAWKYQLKTPADVQAGIPPDSCSHPFHSMAISPDRRTIAIGDCVGTIAIVDALSGRELRRLPAYVNAARANNFPGFYSVMSLIFDPANPSHLLCVMGESGSKAVIAQADINTGFLDRLVVSVTDSMPRIALSPDGRVLALGGEYLYLWDRQTRRVLHSSSAGTSGSRFMRMNPRRQEIAIPFGEIVLLVSPRPRREARTLSGGWQPSGVFVLPYSAVYVKATGGEFQIGWNSRHLDAYDYDEIYYHGLNEEYHLGQGGDLVLRATSGQPRVEIYGGLVDRDRNVRNLRGDIPTWGSYWSDMGHTITEVEEPQPTPNTAVEIEEVAPEDADEELRYAINTGNVPLLRGALQAGADVNLRMDLGISALGYAVLGEEEEMVQILIENGADVNARSSIGSTPISQAAYNGYDAIVRRLIAAGADVNLASNAGQTPLMNAALKCRASTIGILLQAGANQSARNEDGENAYQVARSNCYTSRLQEIEAAGLRN
ncbi:MAG: ankyrin repeat domain-containing protein [Leptospiraceae bacterium]|nr:ankyrin repeat domain-containing protein [Leptospiraceae bacterium]